MCLCVFFLKVIPFFFSAEESREEREMVMELYLQYMISWVSFIIYKREREREREKEKGWCYGSDRPHVFQFFKLVNHSGPYPFGFLFLCVFETFFIWEDLKKTKTPKCAKGVLSQNEFQSSPVNDAVWGSQRESGIYFCFQKTSTPLSSSEMPLLYLFL